MTTTREWRDDPPADPAHWGAGAQLRATREAFGMSLDEVAQQLKLAPRQVIALEDEDFAQLPGRTFVRGFVRNYARLLNLNGDELLALLPDAAHAPGMGAPPLQSTGSLKAALPNAPAKKSSFARWMIPLVLVGCIVAAASYEWRRNASSTGEERAPIAPTNEESRSDDKTATSQGTPLPNPLANGSTAESGQQGSDVKSDALSPPPAMTAEPAASVPPASLPVTGPTPTTPATTGAGQTARAPATPTQNSATPTQSASPTQSPPTRAPGTSAATAPAIAAPVIAESSPSVPPPPKVATPTATVLMNYSGPSWTEVRDRNGQVLIARLVPGDSMQAIEGAPPFAIMIGNARAVSLAYRGKSVDLSRYTKNNVARLTLK